MEIARYVLPVVVGSMAGMMLIIFGENFIHQMFVPLGLNLSDPDTLAKGLKLMPARFFVMLLANYAIDSFIAGIIATLISKRTTMRPAIVVGIVLTLAGLYNDIYLPHPTWFTVTNLLTYLPMAFLGYLVVRKKDQPAVL